MIFKRNEHVSGIRIVCEGVCLHFSFEANLQILGIAIMPRQYYLVVFYSYILVSFSRISFPRCAFSLFLLHTANDEFMCVCVLNTYNIFIIFRDFWCLGRLFDFDIHPLPSIIQARSSISATLRICLKYIPFDRNLFPYMLLFYFSIFYIIFPLHWSFSHHSDFLYHLSEYERRQISS